MSSGYPNLEKMEYWAEEFRMPLFWFTNKEHPSFRDDIMVVYKNNRMLMYYLNDRQGREEDLGYKYFCDSNNIGRYDKEAKETIGSIKKLIIESESVDFGNLDKTILIKWINRIVNVEFINAVTVYTKTEPMRLKRFENNNELSARQLKILGDARLKLRQTMEMAFYVLFGQVLNNFAKQSGVTIRNLFFYDHEEMQLLFKGNKVRQSVLDKRKKGYSFWRENSKKGLLIGNDFKNIWKEAKVKINQQKKEPLTGFVASCGVAQGKVRVIIHNKSNISKEVNRFRKGEILVTEMTRPQTIMACKKAAAIITDEGGVTSHAAIISRELGIPAIIGTKIATKALKDGDLVEVNGDEGTIKVLNKKR
jgi:phosphohistidine swiveling domain-containing protein